MRQLCSPSKLIFLDITLTFLVASATPAIASTPSCGTPAGVNRRTFNNPDTLGTPQSISLTTPRTFAACPQFECCNRVFTEGVPANWKLEGRIVLLYFFTNACDSNGNRLPREVIETIPINQYGNLDIQVCYPKVSDWKSFEIHTDISISVRDQNGLPISWIPISTLGPGNDWDTFCSGTSLGCTPGFWKNHLNSWPISPSSFFDVVFGAGPHITLLDAINATGNKSGEALLRHAVAALLNAIVMNGEMPAWPCGGNHRYEFTPTHVISFVQSAFATGNFSLFKDMLATANERLCALADPPVWLDTTNFMSECDPTNPGLPCNPFWIPPF